MLKNNSEVMANPDTHPSSLLDFIPQKLEKEEAKIQPKLIKKAAQAARSKVTSPQPVP